MADRTSFFKDVYLTPLAIRIGASSILTGVSLILVLALTGSGVGTAFIVGLTVMAVGILIAGIAAIVQAKYGKPRGNQPVAFAPQQGGNYAR